MEIINKPCGDYQTNCYIIKYKNFELIIDPGIGAFDWIKQQVKNPKAIFNTHGHFDHIWDNQKVKNYFNIPIYCSKQDAFMLQNDPFGYNIPKSTADILVNPNQKYQFDDLKIIFYHFPGHTPGSMAIMINNYLFSGDFIFKGSIGRVDFPYSNATDMKKSINTILSWDKDCIIYPGHGIDTTLFQEKNSLKGWLNYL
jgi:glyoxylase-like metal-dependent hydrolase (beta-lactamase superfamily II)